MHPMISEVLEFVRESFAELHVKKVEGLAHGTPWVEQFRQFHDVVTCQNLTLDILGHSKNIKKS